MIPGVHTFLSLEVSPFPVCVLRLSIFHSVNTLAPYKVLRQSSHLKDNRSPLPVAEPASLFAVMLTATGVQQFPQLRSSFEYSENFRKQISVVTNYMASNQMKWQSTDCVIIHHSPRVVKKDFPGLLKLINTDWFFFLFVFHCQPVEGGDFPTLLCTGAVSAQAMCALLGTTI